MCIIREAIPSDELRELGEKVINKFPEFDFIKEFNIRIGYVSSYEVKKGERIVYADCRKVNTVFQAFIPLDIIITFYEYNTEMLSENQKAILMKHELKHIGMNNKGVNINPHEIEDFKDILRDYGNDWNEVGKIVPDILE